MTRVHNLGFPRIGHKRELKKALESFWSGEIDGMELEARAAQLRERHWRIQQTCGVELIPVGDFSLYDQMLDMSCTLGAVPPRYGFDGKEVDLATFFAMARGSSSQPAMEMTKWFDTNYHYIVPEFHEGMDFALRSERLFRQVREAQGLGLAPKPVIVGPITYLWLGKEKDLAAEAVHAPQHHHDDSACCGHGGSSAPAGFDRLSLLPKLLPVYGEILARLRELGVEWVQMDEPALTQDLPGEWLEALDRAYAELGKSAAPKILLATYFESVADHAQRLMALPVAGLHLDLRRAAQQRDAFLQHYPSDKILSLGVVDGRNVWRTDLDAALALVEPAAKSLGDRLWLAPSCSLMHSPVDLEQETELDDELKSWLAFAVQKLDELAMLARALDHGMEAVQGP